MLLFLVRMYAGNNWTYTLQIVHGRTRDYMDVRGTIRTYATLWCTFWLIPRCTKYLLDCYVNSIRRMLGLADVHCFFGEMVEPLSYKYPLRFINSHALSTVHLAPRLLKLL
jgi:hypothetical protein